MQSEASISEHAFQEIPEFFMHITQDNAGHRLIIDDVNSGFADLLGIAVEKLLGMNVLELLAPASFQALEDMEFTADAPDFFDIFSKQRHIKWKTIGSEEITFPLSIARIDAHSSDVRFKLSVPNERNARARARLSDFLQAHFEGHQVLDPETGLTNRSSGLGFFESLSHFAKSNDLPVAFATIRIDRFPKSFALYGEQACIQLLQHVAHGCRRALAPEDVVVRLRDDQLALILCNVSRESARVILNRLRWLIRSHRIVFGGKSEFSVTVSFAFGMMNPDAPNDVVESCEQALIGLPEDERNRLIELAA